MALDAALSRWQQAFGAAEPRCFNRCAALPVAAGKFEMDAARHCVGSRRRGGSLVERSSPIVGQISIHKRPTPVTGPVETLQQRVAGPEVRILPVSLLLTDSHRSIG